MKIPLWLISASVVCLAALSAAAPAPSWDEVRRLNSEGLPDPQSGRLVYMVDSKEYGSTNTRQGALAHSKLELVTQTFDDGADTAREDFSKITAGTPAKPYKTELRKNRQVTRLDTDPNQLQKYTATGADRFSRDHNWLESGLVPFSKDVTGQYLRTENFRGSQALVYEVRPAKGTGVRGLVWLAPAFGYQMTHVELWGQTKLHREQTNSGFRSVNGVMIPHTIESTEYAPGKTALPFLKSETVTLREATLNRPLPSDAFALVLPSDTIR